MFVVSDWWSVGQIADCKFQIADFRFKIANFRLQMQIANADCRFKFRFRVQTTNLGMTEIRRG
jgi:hypothetical protein